MSRGAGPRRKDEEMGDEAKRCRACKEAVPSHEPGPYCSPDCAFYDEEWAEAERETVAAIVAFIRRKAVELREEVDDDELLAVVNGAADAIERGDWRKR